MRVPLTIFFFLLAAAAYGQVGLTAAGQVRGTVVDAASGEPVAAVTVVNALTRQSVYTGTDGSFAIPGRPGEIIRFSYLGYQTFELTVSEGSSYLPQRISLQRQSYELDEYVFRPKYSPYQLDSIQRKSTYQRALARERVRSLGSPVTLLADRISKKSKQVYRFQKEFNYWEDQRFIDSRYSPELVAQLTHLGGDTLAHFMNEYPMPYDYARVASELELKMWIREHYREWLRKQEAAPAAPADTTTTADSLNHRR